MPKRKPKQSPRPTGRGRLGPKGKGIEKKKKDSRFGLEFEKGTPPYGTSDHLDNQVIAIDCRYGNGKWTKIITSYGNGKEVTEYNDKRKKDKVEWL